MSAMGDGTAPAAPAGRRGELLAAAREVLAQKGYERTTVSSIATRANVAQGTFYLYFPSKEALPGALARQLSEALAVSARAALDGVDDLDAAIDALVRSSWATAADHSDMLMIANRGIELAETFDALAEVTAPFREVIEQMLARFQAAGDIPADVDRVMTAYVLRDLIDRSVKAKVCFGQEAYGDAISLLVRRALSA